MQSSDTTLASFLYWFMLLNKICFAFGVNSSRHIKDNHLQQAVCWAVRLTAGVQWCRCAAHDSSVHNLQAASHSFLLLKSAASFSCSPSLSSTPVHPPSRTLMPFRSVSHVTNTDMNFRVVRDPITAEDCSSRTHHSVFVPSIKRVRESVRAALSVYVWKGETRVNTRLNASLQLWPWWRLTAVSLQRPDSCQKLTDACLHMDKYRSSGTSNTPLSSASVSIEFHKIKAVQGKIKFRHLPLNH